MSDVKNDTPQEEEVEDYSDLDDILNSEDEKKEEAKKDEIKEEADEKNGDQFYKKVGNREFSSEEDYDSWVQKVYGENSNLVGAVKKLGKDPKKVLKGDFTDEQVEQKKEEVKEPEKKDLSDEEQYYRVEKIRFEKKYPVAKEYKEEMGIFIRKGKANINDEPSYALALAKSLRADGEKIPEKLLSQIKTEKGEDTTVSATKKVMKAGGSSNTTRGKEVYNKENLDNISSFANSLV